MGKLACICGHVISDTKDNLSYKGYILPDTKWDGVSEAFSNIVDSLSEANKLGKRLDWIKKNFSAPPYPTDLNDSSMLSDLISTLLIDNKQDIFECEECGRIAIEVGQSNHFKFFKPESSDTKGILNSIKEVD